jgi:AhpD family alkylhydroperoxidase
MYPISRTLARLTLIAGLAFAGARAETRSPDPAAATFADIEQTLGFVPAFFRDIPVLVLPGTWEELKGLEISDKTAIPCKYKELIGLAVAAQIPCEYCIESHTQFARLGGADKEEVSEAIGIAGLTRHWSTFFNGMQLDESKFKAELKQALENIKTGMASGAQPPKPIEVTDGKTALADATQNFGFAPEFLKRFPDAGLAGAYKAYRDLEMNPSTALPGKYKDLISLAVSSQIPCRYCILSDTEFAKLDGASEAEIAEAVALGGLTREFSALLNGAQTDIRKYRSDLGRIAKSMAAVQDSRKKSTAKAK